MTQLFYKERTPVTLNNILLSNPYFAEHWKLIPLAVKMYNHILHCNHADNGFSSITYRRFEARFHDDYIPMSTMDLVSSPRMTPDATNYSP